jgi:hypothetical protein
MPSYPRFSNTRARRRSLASLGSWRLRPGKDPARLACSDPGSLCPHPCARHVRWRRRPRASWTQLREAACRCDAHAPCSTLGVSTATRTRTMLRLNKPVRPNMSSSTGRSTRWRAAPRNTLRLLSRYCGFSGNAVVAKPCRVHASEIRIYVEPAGQRLVALVHKADLALTLSAASGACARLQACHTLIVW